MLFKLSLNPATNAIISRESHNLMNALLYLSFNLDQLQAGNDTHGAHSISTLTSRNRSIR